MSYYTELTFFIEEGKYLKQENGTLEQIKERLLSADTLGLEMFFKIGVNTLGNRVLKFNHAINRIQYCDLYKTMIEIAEEFDNSGFENEYVVATLGECSDEVSSLGEYGDMFILKQIDDFDVDFEEVK